MFFDSSVYIASGLLSTRALTGKRSAGNAPAPSKKSRKGKGSASAQADKENVSVQSTRFTLTAFVKRGKSGAAAAKEPKPFRELNSDVIEKASADVPSPKETPVAAVKVVQEVVEVPAQTRSDPFDWVHLEQGGPAPIIRRNVLRKRHASKRRTGRNRNNRIQEEFTPIPCEPIPETSSNDSIVAISHSTIGTVDVSSPIATPVEAVESPSVAVPAFSARSNAFFDGWDDNADAGLDVDETDTLDDSVARVEMWKRRRLLRDIEARLGRSESQPTVTPANISVSTVSPVVPTIGSTQPLRIHKKNPQPSHIPHTVSSLKIADNTRLQERSAGPVVVAEPPMIIPTIVIHAPNDAYVATPPKRTPISRSRKQREPEFDAFISDLLAKLKVSYVETSGTAA